MSGRKKEVNMSDLLRPPWSIRNQRDPAAEEAFQALGPDIPEGLHSYLTDFIQIWFGDESFASRHRTVNRGRAQMLGAHLNCDPPLDYLDDFVGWAAANDDRLLDVIDFALGLGKNSQAVMTLMAAFDISRSSLRVVIDSENGGAMLEHAQPPELTDLVERAGRSGHTAAVHLRKAWELCFRRDEPDFTAAAHEAVRAVESASIGVVAPTAHKPSLGQIISDMRAKPSKWVTGLEGADSSVEAVIAMMKMVWDSDKRARHGQPDQKVDVGQAECEMVLHTAAVLVHWFTDEDYIRRV